MRSHRPPLLSARLDHEWRALAHRHDAVARANSWHVVPDPFGDLDELLERCGYRAEPTAAHNDALARLVVVGRTDDLAARVVLQRVLPGLLGVSSRRRSADRDAFEELAGAAWLAIKACRTDRTQHVAANIVRDAAYRAFTAPARRRSATEIAVDPRALDDRPAEQRVGACEELAGLLGEARAAGVASADLDLVRTLAAVGSPGRVAAMRSVTPRTVRNHRDRITATLRRIASDAA